MLYVRATPISRPTFFSDPLHACLLISATMTGVAGAAAALLAVVAKHERSFLVFVSILLGAFVLYVTIGTMAGLNQ